MFRRALTLTMSLLVVAAIAGPVTAASPHQVDPATVSPPLNPAFAPWTCTATGAGSTCHGFFSAAWTDEDLGLDCDGRPIIATGSATTDGTRWNDANGNATASSFHNEVAEVWSLVPGGRQLTLRSRFTERFVYAVPGVVSTRTYTLTGGYYQVSAQGVGLVWHDVGFDQLGAAASGSIEVVHGPHDSTSGNLELILPAACGVLMG